MPGHVSASDPPRPAELLGLSMAIWQFATIAAARVPLIPTFAENAAWLAVLMKRRGWEPDGRGGSAARAGAAARSAPQRRLAKTALDATFLSMAGAIVSRPAGD